MIRKCWILPLMLLCSCAPKVIIRDDWGGMGGTASTKIVKPSLGEMSVAEVQKAECASSDNVGTPYGSINQPAGDTSVKTKVQPARKERYPRIDTLPPASMMNGADSMLLAARNDFIRAEQIRSRHWIGILTIALAALGGTLASVFYLLPSLSGLGILGLFFFLLVISTLFSLLGYLLLFILLRDTVTKRKGIGKIIAAPPKAPASRRIEYEVRCLKMVRRYMSPSQISKKVDFIRELGKTEPDNPWLKELNGMSVATNPGKIRQYKTWHIVLLVVLLLALRILPYL